MSRMLGAYFLPGTDRVSVLTDGRTAGYLALVALGVGLVTGLFPLIQARRLTLRDDLAGGARAGRFRRSVARPGLVVLQAALSVVLLVGAGLFVRSVRNVRDVRIGFDAGQVLVVGKALRDVRLDSAASVALRMRLLRAATAMPEVAYASLQESEPLSGDETSFGLYIAGIDSVDRLGQFDLNLVSGDYFATMGTRILRGRGIRDSDTADAPPVAVVGLSTANVLWPGKDPVGQCMHVISPTTACTTVVGVAEDIRSRSLGPEGRQYYYYLAAMQVQPQQGGLFVRAKGDPSTMMESLRRRLQREMPGSSYVLVSRLSDRVDDEMRSWVMGATSFAVFGALALLLAAIGLYSAVAYAVAQRRHELALRVALGAMTRDLLRHVVSGGVRVAGLGVLIGAAIAVGSARWIEPLLFQESPRDPGVFALVILVLLAVAVVASVIPAVRATRTDPRMALGEE